METWATETPILVKTAIQFLQARRFQLLRLIVVDLSHEVLSAVLQLRNGPTITCNIFFYGFYFPEVFSFCFQVDHNGKLGWQISRAPSMEIPTGFYRLGNFQTLHHPPG